DSDEIVPAAGSRRPVLQGEELAGCLEPRLLGSRTGNAPPWLDLQPCGLHRPYIALVTVAPGRGLVGAADHGDTGMTQRDEVICGQCGAVGIVAAENRHMCALHVA